MVAAMKEHKRGIIMKVLGIDLGSRSVKVAVLENKEIVHSDIIDTHLFYKNHCENIDGKININFENLKIDGIEKIVSTGYGRNNINIIGAEIITELKAHTYGAIWQTDHTTFTLLDVGGQDSKVICIKNGKMIDMVLNDKCAASCGRYLENMATVMGMTITEAEKYYIEPIELSSTCAVFGESELIGRISEGHSLKRIAAGVNYSLFKRIKPLIERFPNETLVITGGVAKNEALVHFIKKELGFINAVIPKEPQLNGAIGCCIYATGGKL